MSDPEHQAEHGTGLGDRLKRLRRQRGMTMERLAEAVACSKGYLSAIENGRPHRPSDALLHRLEEALGCSAGSLTGVAQFEDTPAPIRRELSHLRERHRDARRLVDLLRGGTTGVGGVSTLDSAHASGELRRLIDRLSPETEVAHGCGFHGLGDLELVALPREVPLINKVAAGYPTEFTDLGYPARVADEYVRCPDIADADAFAARVVGDSMLPEYRQGDVVVFSPARDVCNGDDCFARLEPDHETTFKRVFFEGESGEEQIRLQPLNPAYPPRVVPRDQVAGLYAAVTVMRRIG